MRNVLREAGACIIVLNDAHVLAGHAQHFQLAVNDSWCDNGWHSCSTQQLHGIFHLLVFFCPNKMSDAKTVFKTQRFILDCQSMFCVKQDKNGHKRHVDRVDGHL